MENAIDWFVLREGEYVSNQLVTDGLLRSQVFPGLWLDVDALLRGDLSAVLAAVTRGTCSPEHAAFVRRLNPTHHD
jgi:hypothetical protein